MQLRQNSAEAARYAAARRSILFQKELAITLTLNTYLAMALARRDRAVLRGRPAPSSGESSGPGEP